ncbi:MAG: hypothetical protein LAT55_13010 [Opitutales bacterium]|nr:hypothetical protein [Opitutales bacterium]
MSETIAPWPAGCRKPNACARHRACVYRLGTSNCPHETRWIDDEVGQAIRSRGTRIIEPNVDPFVRGQPTQWRRAHAGDAGISFRILPLTWTEDYVDGEKVWICYPPESDSAVIARSDIEKAEFERDREERILKSLELPND